MAAAAINAEYGLAAAGEEADGSSDDNAMSRASSSASGCRQRPQAKRYKRQGVSSSAAAVAATALSQQQKSSATKRRILCKDRRATFDTLTSDDDVNEYEETRPSSYMEPMARRTMHEVEPHLKSSFETLYNPELNQAVEDHELLSLSLSSSCDSVDALNNSSMLQNYASRAVAGAPETWHIVSGPMVPPKKGSYHDVTQSLPANDKAELPVSKQETTKAPTAHHDHLDKGKYLKKPSPVLRQDTYAPESHNLGSYPDNASIRGNKWNVAVKSRKSKPINLSIKVSNQSEQGNRNVQLNPALGVDLTIEMGKAAKRPSTATTKHSPIEITVDSLNTEVAADAEESDEQKKWAKLPERMLLLLDSSSLRKPNPLDEISSGKTQPAVVSVSSANVAEKPHSKRILPAVPDSADLEVTDLLRETQGTVAANRPKSAVDILVSKSRSGSILQADVESTQKVSQQLRSLFHNPSPLIMLHRAATRPTPPPPPLPQSDNSEYLSQQQPNRFMPLRGAHHRVDDTRRNGAGSTRSALSTTNPIPPHSQPQKSQRSDQEPVQSPELPFRRNRSLLPKHRLQQEPPQPQHAAHATAFLSPPLPPPVPPRQAKSIIARQQSASTFYPNKLQLVFDSSTGPPIIARTRHEIIQDFGQSIDTKCRERSSIDHLYMRVLESPAQAEGHTIVTNNAPELHSDDSGEYLLARNPVSTDQRRLMPIEMPLTPSRIQTNPHLGSRAGDSITRREESDDKREAEPIVIMSQGSKLDLLMDFASLMSKGDDEVGSMTLTTANTDGQGQTLPQNRPTAASQNCFTVKDSVRRQNKMAEAMSHISGRETTPHASARDVLFNHWARLAGKPNIKTNSQPVVTKAAASIEKDASPREASSITEPQSASSPRFAMRNGKEMRMPPNAVRVLPYEDDSELQRRMRALGSRSAGWSPRAPTDDAVAGLEKMCRDMRLEDECLLDGAERHDTSIRVQVQMDALNAAGGRDANQMSSSTESTTDRPYYVQHRGILPFNRDTDDQARRFQADSNRRYNAATKSQPHMHLVKAAGTKVNQPMTVFQTAGRDQEHQLPG